MTITAFDKTNGDMPLFVTVVESRNNLLMGLSNMEQISEERG